MRHQLYHHERHARLACCLHRCRVLTCSAEFCIGREEAIYFYEPEGRGACRPFEGKKVFVTWFRSYLVVVSEDPNSKQHQANIYDLANQYNAFSQAFPNVTHVVSEWGQIFLFCGAWGGARGR